MPKKKKDLSSLKQHAKPKASSALTSTNILDVDVSALKRDVAFDAHFVTEGIINFGILLTAVPLYSYQYEIAYRIIYAIITFENDILTVLLSRQSGKSEVMAFIIDSLCVLLPKLALVFPDLDQFKNGVHIGLFAPQSEQVWTTYSRALSKIGSEESVTVLEDPDIDVYLNKSTKFMLSNGSSLVGQVASKQSKIESKTYDIIIIEEAQDVDSYIITKSIEPMVSATGGTIIKCGTTGTSKNNYWDDIQINRRKNVLAKDKRLLSHLEYDYKKIFIAKREQYAKDSKRFHLSYEIDVTKKMERWGRDSQAFRLSYALEWDLESGMLLTDKEFEKICNRRKGHTLDKQDVVVAGLDIGKEDNPTILTLIKLVWSPLDEDGSPPRKEVIGWLELQHMSYAIQHQEIIDCLYEYGVVSLYADYTGVGKAVVDQLMWAVGDSINITPFNFSKQSKSEMWFNLISDIQNKTLVIPANKEVQQLTEFHKFKDQLTNCLKYHDGPYIVCHKQPGGYDDYVDSLGLACLATNFEISEEIDVSDSNPLFANTLNNRTLRKKNDW